MFSHISDIRRNKNGPVSRHFNNADSLFGAEENTILYPIEQILIRVLHRETNILDSEQSLLD